VLVLGVIGIGAVVAGTRSSGDGALASRTQNNESDGPAAKAVADVKTWIHNCPNAAVHHGYRPDGVTPVEQTDGSDLVTVAVPWDGSPTDPSSGNNFYLDVNTLTGTISPTSDRSLDQTRYYYVLYENCLGDYYCALSNGQPTHGFLCSTG
jgi:hypothetical protein